LPARSAKRATPATNRAAHPHDGDPVDRIPHSPKGLIERAATLGYQVLAITLHERQLDVRRWEAYARDRGIVLILGIERTISGKHVLLIDFRRGAESLQTFLTTCATAANRTGPGHRAAASLLSRLIVPRGAIDLRRSLRRLRIQRDVHLVVEFLRSAVEWATTHGKPIVANCDVHRLHQLGSTYSLIDAPPDAGAICEADCRGARAC
jgi:predicted metal-dependent phosphoesterase TrpH